MSGKRRLSLVAALCVAQGAMAALGVAMALLMRGLIDAAVAGDGGRFWLLSVEFGTVLVAQVVLRFVSRSLNENARASLDNALRNRVFGQILSMDLRDSMRYHSGSLMNRLTSDVQVVTDGAVSLAPLVCAMGIRLVGVMWALFSLTPALAVLFMVGGVIVAVVSAVLRPRLKRMHRAVQEAEGTVRVFLQECLESMLVIHAYGCEEKVLRTNAANMGAHREERLRRNRFSNLCGSGFSLAVQLSYLVGFVWCGYGILRGTLTYGTLMAVVQLIGQVQSPFASLSGSVSRYAAMLASAERLMELRGADGSRRLEDEASREGLRERCRSMTELRFDHVSFAYDDDRPVLDDFSLTVRRGETVAFAGPSGIGKSTALKLLLGVYAPLSGRVEVAFGDGAADVADLPAGLFAYVPQGNNLMSGTIREVVAFSDDVEKIDDARVRRACEEACASDFVEALPRGYETVLGERGYGLSEGQMQRLAIARALYSGAPILLLDEATSALDSGTERRLLASLKELEDRTVLIVSHRSGTLAACDRIIDLKEEPHGPAQDRA